MEALSSRPDPTSSELPRHVAIIMDGNGRWALARRRPRSFGHWRGAKIVRMVVESALELGISYLTLYGFSSENWKRPKAEVSAVMSVIREFLIREIDLLARRGVRIRFIGERQLLSPEIVALMEDAETRTCGNGALNLIVALSYGGRQEIVVAARRLAFEAAAQEIDPRMIDDLAIERRLFTADIPDPELIIRTSGEQRISNFMLWQSARSRLAFPETLWPNFSKDEFTAAVLGGPAQGREPDGGDVPPSPPGDALRRPSRYASVAVGRRSSGGAAGAGPPHVAIVMDGGDLSRQRRALSRRADLQSGVDRVRTLIDSALDCGISYLTLCGPFERGAHIPKTERVGIVALFRLYLTQGQDGLDRRGVRIRFVGDREFLGPEISALIDAAEERTCRNAVLTLVIALRHGGRAEIAGAVRSLALDAAAGRLDPQAIDEAALSRRLSNPDIPDPDFVIRTGGGPRISDVLLWQGAYAELAFRERLWLNPSKAEFVEAMRDYSGRERRFGTTDAP